MNVCACTYHYAHVIMHMHMALYIAIQCFNRHAEKLRRHGKSSDAANKLKIPSLEWHRAFRPRKGEPGNRTLTPTQHYPNPNSKLGIPLHGVYVVQFPNCWTETCKGKFNKLYP